MLKDSNDSQPVFPDHPYYVASWQITNSGRTSWMTTLYKKILGCLKNSHSMKEFKANLSKKGISVEHSKFKNKVYKNHFVYSFHNAKHQKRFIGGKKLNLDKDKIVLALRNGFKIRKY